MTSHCSFLRRFFKAPIISNKKAGLNGCGVLENGIRYTAVSQFKQRVYSDGRC